MPWCFFSWGFNTSTCSSLIRFILPFRRRPCFIDLDPSFPIWAPIDQIILRCGSCPEHCRMLSRHPGFYRLKASSSPLPMTTTKIVPRRCRVSPPRAKSDHVWTDLELPYPYGVFLVFLGNQNRLKAFDSAWADGAKRNSCDLTGETFWKMCFAVFLWVLDLRTQDCRILHSPLPQEFLRAVSGWGQYGKQTQR